MKGLSEPESSWLDRRKRVAKPDRHPRAFPTEARDAFRRFVLAPEFPCLGAKAAFHSGSYVLAFYGKLGSDAATVRLCADLYDFTKSEMRRTSEFATFVAIFSSPTQISELQYEKLLWSQLRRLHQVDVRRFPWDPEVGSDPADPHFSFSFAGQALYVIGMHASSSRQARRFKWPTLIFNPHEQFERLRADGQWRKMQETIRSRDQRLQGTINPMLSDFGERSEARQYSGRAVEENWRAPFAARRATAFSHRKGQCPFAD